jgi:hypothetical protein
MPGLVVEIVEPAPTQAEKGSVEDAICTPLGQLFDLTAFVTANDLENQEDYAGEQRQDANGGESRVGGAYPNSRQQAADND